MPTNYKKKPLGAWPDSKKHKATETPQEEGEQSQSGHMPDPEEVEDKDVLERAKKAGLYDEYSDQNEGEVSVADEEEEDLEDEDQS